MTKITKRLHKIYQLIDPNKKYHINDAIVLLKKTTSVNFIESVDVSIHLSIDTRKSEQNIRGTIIFPYGIGRSIRIAVFTHGINAEIANNIGVELVGMEDLANKIKTGKFNYDIIIASPDAMQLVGTLGHILGPRGLMPNPKLGTVTSNISLAVRNAKAGQIFYHNDKNGIIHTTIGKINFDDYKIKENLEALLIALKKNKPSSAKGIFIKKVNLSTTMGGGVNVDYT